MTGGRRALLLLLVAALLLAAADLPRLARGHVPLDLRTFYLAPRLDGADLYDPAGLARAAATAGLPAEVYPYLYPPLLARGLGPLAALSPGAAAVAWTLLSAAAAALALGLGAGRRAGPLLLLAPAVLLPFVHNLRMGQANLLVLVWLAGAVAAARRDRDLLAGLLLAPAAAVKVTPLGLLVWFALERRWRALAGCAVGLAALVLPTLATAAGRDAWSAFGHLLPRLGWGAEVPGLFPAAVVPNLSLAGALARWLPAGAVAPATLLLLAGLGAALVVRHRRLAGTDAAPALLLPYLVLMVAGAPLAYRHHLVLLAPGLAAALAAAARLPSPRRGRWLAALALLALLAGADWPAWYDALALPQRLRAVNLAGLLGLFAAGLRLPASGRARTG